MAALSDEPTYTYHRNRFGDQYVRCEYCGAERLTKLGGIDYIDHRPDCLRPL